MPVHQGIIGLTLHHFSRREICCLLEAVGFQILDVRPVGLTGDEKLPKSWLLPAIRAYGYLVAAGR